MKSDWLSSKPRRWRFHTPHQLFVAFLMNILVIAGICFLFSLLGCRVQETSLITPMENQLGSKIMLQSSPRNVLVKFDKITVPNPVAGGLGYFVTRYNSKEFMHERYYQFNFREPALTPFEFQLNTKVKSYILGKYGRLP